MRTIPALAAATGLALLLALPLRAETFKEAFPDIVPQIMEQYRDRTAALQLLHGTIPLGAGDSQVAVAPGYYMLGPADARYVLETLWGNPPDDTVQGLLFPPGMTPFDQQGWVATFQFDPMGYVSDADAEGYDYDALLEEMKADATSENALRQKDGYPTVTLLGWAEPPHYDQASRSLFWAKRLQFSGSQAETLNYNIRVLGRKGVLVINFIADMTSLEQVRQDAPKVAAMVSYTQGNRYSDYVPGVDTVAAMGIGGLIAGKVLANSGLLAIALLFLKKAGFLVLVPVAWVWNRLRGRSSGPGA